MSIALQNQVDTLETKVQELTRQIQELTALLKPASIQAPKRGRPPKQTQGHMQP